jgi:peptide/nickel transport system substrate-binding protein
LSGHRLLAWTPRAYFFIVWNTARPPLGDARVRRALTLLTDRARFTELAFGGRARPVTGPYALGTPSYDATVNPWPHDPAAARALLAEAGVNHLALKFLITAGSRTVEQLATLMKEDLGRAGIDLTVEPVDFAVQLERLRHHQFDVSSLQWTLSLEQDNFAMFHSSQADHGQNYGGYASARADALLERIRATEEDGPRHELDRALHRLLHEDQPYTFLSSPEVQTLLGPRVRGLRPSIDGFDFVDAWLE